MNKNNWKEYMEIQKEKNNVVYLDEKSGFAIVREEIEKDSTHKALESALQISPVMIYDNSITYYAIYHYDEYLEEWDFVQYENTIEDAMKYIRENIL